MTAVSSCGRAEGTEPPPGRQCDAPRRRGSARLRLAARPSAHNPSRKLKDFAMPRSSREAARSLRPPPRTRAATSRPSRRRVRATTTRTSSITSRPALRADRARALPARRHAGSRGRRPHPALALEPQPRRRAPGGRLSRVGPGPPRTRRSSCRTGSTSPSRRDSARSRPGAASCTGRPSPPQKSEERVGFRVTTPLRTLLDVAGGTTSGEQVEKAVAEALRPGARRGVNSSRRSARTEARSHRGGPGRHR